MSIWPWSNGSDIDEDNPPSDVQETSDIQRSWWNPTHSIDRILLSLERTRQLNMTEDQLGITTATIYIYMHGSFLGNSLPESSVHRPFPTNSVIGGSMGLCLIDSNINTSERLFDRITISKDLFSRYNIPQSNRLFIEKGLWDPYHGNSGTLRAFIDSDATIKETNPNEYKLPYGRFNMIRRYLKIPGIPLRPEHFLRSYSYDKSYSLGNERENTYMGIYLIHTNHARLRSSYKECDQIPLYTKNPVYKALQQTNLVNKKCVDQLCHLYSIPNSLHNTETIYDIEKYHSIKLSDILYFFASLGIQHLNIIDHSCNNVYSDIPHGLQRQISFDAKKKYGKVTARIDRGGRKTKRRHKLRKL
jgi:hypothetical protein